MKVEDASTDKFGVEAVDRDGCVLTLRVPCVPPVAAEAPKVIEQGIGGPVIGVRSNPPEALQGRIQFACAAFDTLHLIG